MNGIAFKADMVRAIQEARKSQTRRLAPTFTDEHGWAGFPNMGYLPVKADGSPACTPRYSVGGVLWVKEPLYRKDDFVYRAADNTKVKMGEGDRYYREFRPTWPWKPSRLGAMYCPRWASRITIKITDVRVERLQDISEEDAVAEGFPAHLYSAADMAERDQRFAELNAITKTVPACPAVAWYRGMWFKINDKKAPWESNPWVWVYVFEVQK